ncbi:MAG: hypothetical protein P8Z00_18985 [Anaerolineales bacterium]
MKQLSDSLFALSSDIRYVALRIGDRLSLQQREDISEASSSESDRYEELLVNPTLLTLVGERGRIDCGGLEFIIIRYGNFFQLVHPVKEGHVSIAIEPSGDPLNLVAGIRQILTLQNLWPVT